MHHLVRWWSSTPQILGYRPLDARGFLRVSLFEPRHQLCPVRRALVCLKYLSPFIRVPSGVRADGGSFESHVKATLGRQSGKELWILLAPKRLAERRTVPKKGGKLGNLIPIEDEVDSPLVSLADQEAERSLGIRSAD
jgi:hypothetical protein